MIKNEGKYLIYDRPRVISVKYFIKYFIAELENIRYTIELLLFRPRVYLKKYNVTVCAIFKNEATYLKEWIEYHLIVGIDHFYLYNNNSSDNYLEVLKPYIEKGIITLIDWPYDQAQLKAYADCIDNNRKDTKWIGFIDIDEFIVPNKEDNVYVFLRKFEKNRPVVKLYWKLFGSSGLIDRNRDGLVIEDFTVCWEKYDEVGKCFYNTAYDFDPQNKNNKGFLHCIWANYKGIALPPVNCFGKICNRGFEKITSAEFPIQLNHYFTKSYTEYIEKKSKGDAFFKANPHDMDYFYRHEMLCHDTDYHIYKYLVKLKLSIKKEKD